MSDLTDFLLARIAHDVQVYSGHQHGLSAEMVKRLLSECEVKRRIVERCSPRNLSQMHESMLANEILSFLALPYAGHRSYREEWKP